MYYILLFLMSTSLLAEDPGFKPLPTWLFIAIIIFLLGAKVLIGKFVKNKMKKDDKALASISKKEDK